VLTTAVEHEFGPEEALAALIPIPAQMAQEGFVL
jgi:hypothetical protein